MVGGYTSLTATGDRRLGMGPQAMAPLEEVAWRVWVSTQRQVDVSSPTSHLLSSRFE
jgi:hypothetical protein